MPSPAGEEYLEAVYRLRAKHGVVRLSAVSEYLRVSPPSASAMLKRLCEKGLLRRTEDLGIELTPEGERDAIGTVRKHRLFERFLTDVLGLPWDKVHDEACKLEHAASPEVTEGLEKFLENPKTCPHGSPIPMPDGSYDRVETCQLAELDSGDRAVIVHVDDEEPKMLRYLATLGLIPSVEVTVREIAPFHGPLLVEVGSARYALGREVASRIDVRRG